MSTPRSHAKPGLRCSGPRWPTDKAALFIGTPRGYNHFYDLYQKAQNQPNWATFQYTTEEGGNVTPEELESATHELDERTYRQEFQASFENLTAGLVYYAFDRAENVRTLRYNPRLPLFWSLDFNVNPMCSVIGQRDGDACTSWMNSFLPDSNTWAACEAFWEKIAPYRAAGTLRCTDPRLWRRDGQRPPDVGVAHGLANRPRFLPYHVLPNQSRVPSPNPPVKDRINCVNAMLHNQAGERRLLIDPRCKELILDFERVHWKNDAHGNTLADIDKSDPARSHVSDALGYMIAYDFGMRGKSGEMPGPPPR